VGWLETGQQGTPRTPRTRTNRCERVTRIVLPGMYQLPCRWTGKTYTALTSWLSVPFIAEVCAVLHSGRISGCALGG